MSNRTIPTRLSILATFCVLALLLLGGGCSTVPTGDGGTTRGLDVAKAQDVLGRTHDVLIRLRDAAAASGQVDVQTDRIISTLADAIGNLREITGKSDLNTDGVVGGNTPAGLGEWMAFSTSALTEILWRITQLGTIDTGPIGPAVK